MEEEKAAAYYEELVRKGGNAARFKQGLGFGGAKGSEVSSSSIFPKRDAHASSSLSNFVKQASPGRAAAIQTEIKAESIRDKLKKKETVPSDDHHDSRRKHRPRNDEKFVSGSRQESRKDAEHVSGNGSPLRDRPRQGHSNSPDPSSGQQQRSPRWKHDSPSSNRNARHSHDSRSLSSSSEHSSSRDFGDRRSRRGNHDGRSPSSPRLRTSHRDSSRDDGSPRRRWSKARMPLPQDHGDSSDCSPSRLKKSRQWGHRDERDRSQSQLKERRQRDHRDSSSNWLKERSRRKRRRSHSFSSDSDERSFRHSPRRGRIQSSSDRSRKRSRTPLHSRNPRDQSHSTERRQEWTRRSSSRDRDRRRRGTSVERIRKGRSLSLSQEREKGNGDGRSERPGRSSATRVDTSSRRHSRNGDSKTKVKTRAPDRDFLKLIPNFDSMTPAEKVKAKMKLQLSETVVKDTAKGMTGEWERFDFDKDAPLDDEAKLDYFGDGTGAIDDTGHMRNTGSTLLSTANQARREAQIQAAHDAAIFGAPVATTHGLKTEKGGSGHRVRDSEEDNRAARRRSDATSLTDEEERSKVTETPGTGVVSEQIIAMQSAGSWQERAKKMREARAAAAGLHMEASAS